MWGYLLHGRQHCKPNSQRRDGGQLCMDVGVPCYENRNGLGFRVALHRTLRRASSGGDARVNGHDVAMLPVSQH